MTVPTLVVLAVYSALVHWRVRADRLADLDAGLASRAGAFAGLVERDWGNWEMDDPHPTMLATLTGVQVRGVDGTMVLDIGAPTGRRWTGTFSVRHEGPDAATARVEVTVGASTETLDREMRRLQSVLAAAGVGLSAVAVAVGVALSRRIVGAEELHRLQERFDQQARFTADASHELRTPLALIRTEVDVALRREREPAEYREALNGVRSGAERMQGILEALLLLARADAGGRIEEADLDLQDLAREVAGPVPVGGAPAPMRGDARLLGILIRNLVSNAVQHTPNGSVRVTTGVEGDTVTLTVADQGDGIPPGALARVTERFFRVDSARSRDQGGSGLGLSIVDTVARLHRGTVQIESELGRGTTVTVKFPSGSPQAAVAH